MYRDHDRRAEKVGVSVDLEIYDDMFHVFQNLVGRLPEAQRAINDIAAWRAPLEGRPGVYGA